MKKFKCIVCVVSGENNGKVEVQGKIEAENPAEAFKKLENKYGADKILYGQVVETN